MKFFHLERRVFRLNPVDPAAVTMPEDSGRSLASVEDRWVAALRAGEPAALEKLARAETPRVLGLLHSLLGPRADLEDLMQTVFLEACRALPGFRGDSSVSTFVGGICVRVARRAMRPSAWMRRRADWQSEPLATSGNPEQSAQQAEQLRRVHVALSRLSSKKRAAFLLWSLEGLDVRAIAELMQASVPATKSRILYAQRELRQRAARDPYLRELVEGGRDER